MGLKLRSPVDHNVINLVGWWSIRGQQSDFVDIEVSKPGATYRHLPRRKKIDQRHTVPGSGRV